MGLNDFGDLLFLFLGVLRDFKAFKEILIDCLCLTLNYAAMHKFCACLTNYLNSQFLEVKNIRKVAEIVTTIFTLNSTLTPAKVLYAILKLLSIIA